MADEKSRKAQGRGVFRGTGFDAVLSLPLRPYYLPSGDEWRRAISELVGFDPDLTRQRFDAWLLEHGFDNTDEDGNRRRPPIPEGQSVELVKARALRKASDSFITLGFMHGPERLAGKRWHAALTVLAKALEEFTPYAGVRQDENAYFASRGADDHHAIHDHTRALRETVEGLLRMTREAQAKIVTYVDDPLPGLEGKGHFRYLAEREARLSLAGFTYDEIARLVLDNRRIDDDRNAESFDDEAQRAKVLANAQRAHAERIRKRAAEYRAEIARNIAETDLATASMHAFIARTGGKVRDWFGSPEQEQHEKDLARLREDYPPGK
jgi:hypothetical protein